MHHAAHTGLLQRFEGGKSFAVFPVRNYNAVSFAFFQCFGKWQGCAGIGAQFQHSQIAAEHCLALHVVHVYIQFHIFGNGVGGPQAHLDVLHPRVTDSDVM